MSSPQFLSASDPLHARVLAEYREMPGLSLTAPQAARLWHLGTPACELLLDALVESGYLRKQGSTYRIAGTGTQSR
jgi:hypothetical protein